MHGNSACSCLIVDDDIDYSQLGPVRHRVIVIEHLAEAMRSWEWWPALTERREAVGNVIDKISDAEGGAAID